MAGENGQLALGRGRSAKMRARGATPATRTLNRHRHQPRAHARTVARMKSAILVATTHPDALFGELGESGDLLAHRHVRVPGGAKNNEKVIGARWIEVSTTQASTPGDMMRRRRLPGGFPMGLGARW